MRVSWQPSGQIKRGLEGREDAGGDPPLFGGFVTGKDYPESGLPPPMRVGILGSGPVGQSLGKGFAAHGHDVKLGSKTPDKPEIAKWKQETSGKVSSGTFAEAAAHGEILVLCCLGGASEQVIDLAGPTQFDGKLLIDTTNPLDFSHGMPPGLSVGGNDSLGERHQRKLPHAKVVKCFNIVPNPVMIQPVINGATPDMMIAGNDDAAKAQVVEILREFGWPGAIDIGGIDGARWLEALVPLWVRVSMKLGNFNTAFKVLA
jgi:predicted dinucleotide-binding enzyme